MTSTGLRWSRRTAPLRRFPCSYGPCDRPTQKTARGRSPGSTAWSTGRTASTNRPPRAGCSCSSRPATPPDPTGPPSPKGSAAAPTPSWPAPSAPRYGSGPIIVGLPVDVLGRMCSDRPRHAPADTFARLRPEGRPTARTRRQVRLRAARDLGRAAGHDTRPLLRRTFAARPMILWRAADVHAPSGVRARGDGSARWGSSGRSAIQRAPLRGPNADRRCGGAVVDVDVGGSGRGARTCVASATSGVRRFPSDVSASS